MKRIKFDGEGPFSSINTQTTTLGIANYLEIMGQKDRADKLINEMLGDWGKKKGGEDEKSRLS